VQKVQSSYKDPTSSVFRDGSSQRYFRALPFEPTLYNSLGFFPRVLDTQKEGLYEVEKIPFVSYFYEWTFDQFKDSALYFLELLKSLNSKGYIFSDATPLNITYNGNGQFLFIDHGSLIKKESEQWTAFYQFLKEYAYPLLYLSDNPSLPPLGLLPIMGSKDWMFHYKPGFANRFSIKYALLKSALTLSSKKSLTDFDVKKKTGLSNQYQYNIEFFLDYIKGLSQKGTQKTRWGNYYSETVLGEEYVINKQRALFEFFDKISPEVQIGIDLGSSDGLMAESILKRYPGKKFVCIEADFTASKDLYNKSKKVDITPIYNSLYFLSPAAGFSGSIPSLNSRLSESADVVLALGLIHHLMHEENLPFRKIVVFFISLIRSKGYLILEYISIEDPRHKLIKNPQYPYSTSYDELENAFKSEGTIIQQIQVSEFRKLILFQKH
jgi:hypothetical protein